MAKSPRHGKQKKVRRRGLSREQREQLLAERLIARGKIKFPRRGLSREQREQLLAERLIARGKIKFPRRKPPELDRDALLDKVVGRLPFEIERAYVSGDNQVRVSEIWHDYVVRFVGALDFAAAGLVIDAFQVLGTRYKRHTYYRVRIVKLSSDGYEYAESDRNLSALAPTFAIATNHARSNLTNVHYTVRAGDYAYIKEVSVHVRAPAWYEDARNVSP